MENRIFALDVRALADESRFRQEYEKQRPVRQERVDRMHFDTGKRLCLGAGIVTEQALLYAGCAEEEIAITPEGKPTVKGCFFNLSHTGDIVVCAVSDREVGIDIERPRVFKDELIRRVFTPEEIRWAGKITEDDIPGVQNTTDETGNETAAFGREAGVYARLWTIKEAVMKWYGLGLGLMPEYIGITPGEPVHIAIGKPDVKAPSSVSAQESDGADFSRAEILRLTFFRHEEYRISVCSEYPDFTRRIIWI